MFEVLGNDLGTVLGPLGPWENDWWFSDLRTDQLVGMLVNTRGSEERCHSVEGKAPPVTQVAHIGTDSGQIPAAHF